MDEVTPGPGAGFRLDGRVAVVTGASSGLGVRFAGVLAGAGASVVLAARRAERVAAVAAAIGGDRALGVPCDVTDDGDLARLVDAAVDRFGRLDVVVNNAGTGAPMPAEDEPPDHFRHVLAVNLTAPFVLSQLAARRMLGDVCADAPKLHPEQTVTGQVRLEACRCQFGGCHLQLGVPA
jgi:NAD(P)-dependent dehydrogenase (short-subunit alcohol dehydrogenase family)